MGYLEDFIRRNDFFESVKFNQAIEIISQHQCINQEELKYDPQAIKGLSCQTFSDVCHVVFEHFQDQQVRDENCIFLKYHVDYHGLRFYLMLGQGSTYWTVKSRD